MQNIYAANCDTVEGRRACPSWVGLLQLGERKDAPLAQRTHQRKASRHEWRTLYRAIRWGCRFPGLPER